MMSHLPPAKLEALHVTVLVFGEKYLDLFQRLTLPNLAGRLEEIPADLRAGTRFRILTDRAGREKLERAPQLEAIRRIVAVDLADYMPQPPDRWRGSHGPMLLGQSRFVREASAVGAGIIFCPPDLIWSNGSFATIVRRAREGFRAVIGPSTRVIEEDYAPVLAQRVTQAPHGRLDLSAAEMIDDAFTYWQKMNDGFFWNIPKSYFWKAYAYYWVDKRHFLMKFFQGPAMFLWPYKPVPDYTDWIDHRLIRQCVHSLRQVCVIGDARDLMTVDLAPRGRDEGHRMVSWPGLALFRQLLNRKRHSRYNLLAGIYNCRVYDTALPEAAWREAERRFDRRVTPLIYLALALRPPLAILAGIWRHSGMAALAAGLKRLIRNTPVLWAIASRVRAFLGVWRQDGFSMAWGKAVRDISRRP